MTDKEKSKPALKISLFLHNKKVKKFEDCIKQTCIDSSMPYDVKRGIGLDGKIYVHKPKKGAPDWFNQLNELTNKTIKSQNNVSNKAVIVFKHSRRFFSLTYGYGRSMLNESTIVRNFGLIVAANLVDPQGIKSVNSMTIEDVIVDTQKQSTGFASQDQLQINRQGEIMKSLSGMPKSKADTKFVTGTDSLSATRNMDIKDIKSSIEFYYSTYKRDDYKRNGFEWLDNVQRIKDSSLKSALDDLLVKGILDNEKVFIVPNKIIDWSEISGFYLTGMRKGKNHNISDLIDFDEYFNSIRNNNSINVLGKLKRDELRSIDINSADNKISNIYDGIVFDTQYNNAKYLLCYGDWFEINNKFYTQIKKKIRGVKKCSIVFPPCKKGEREETYNARLAGNNLDYALMDQKFYQPKEYGRSKIEPCDIVTKSKQFIHIKKGGSASKLSHLFAQGIISSHTLSRDDDFKKHINNEVANVLGPNLLASTDRNTSYEIIYAIIDKRSKPIEEVLPFFSMVNLSQTIDNLQSLKFKYSLALIKQEV